MNLTTLHHMRHDVLAALQRQDLVSLSVGLAAMQEETQALLDQLRHVRQRALLSPVTCQCCNEPFTPKGAEHICLDCASYAEVT